MLLEHRSPLARHSSALALMAMLLAGCAGNQDQGSDDGAGGSDPGGSQGSAGAGGDGSGGSTVVDATGAGGSTVVDAAGAGGSTVVDANGTGQGGAGSTGGSGGTAGAGGAAGAGSGTCSGGTALTSDVTVNLAAAQQKISGFGVSTAWGSTVNAGDAALLWSTTTGAGLSLHRVRIDPTTGHTSELNIAKQAVAYGVTVWATPWTPPGADKTGCSGTNCTVEGTLSNPSAYATFLAGFVTDMQGQGVPIYAVSAQNEPDANVTYESCVYTAATMDSFISNSMGPTLMPMGVKIIAPETQNWCTFPSFEPTIVKDSFVSIVATHEYGCNPKAYPDIAQAGKEFWETEIYDTTTNTPDTGMASALRIAKLINDAMTIASMNAWHYWWVYPGAADNSGLWDMATNAPTKRLWVEGNYARFVRPGFQRVGTTGTAPSGVLVSAYTSPRDGTVVIVAVNNNTTATPLSLFVSGGAPCSLTPWVTSSTDSLASKPAVSVTNSRTSVTLGAQSVTTFVGKP